MTDHTPLTEQQINAAIYDSLAAFAGVACWNVLQYAQNRQYLAEHLTDALAPLIADLETATEFRLQPAPPAYTPLIVRRDPAYDGTRWAVLHDPGDLAVRRIWTPEGWEMAWVSTHEETYCWPDVAAALAAARRCQAEDESAEPDVDGVGRTPESYRDRRPAAAPAAVETGE